ncbi:hypothetical protein HMPREF9130_2045 [Peptoniphilus sp. oral taxon 375 str. F0436]|nr:hypothetical protein HMPREF9130_2045 [Peptoniphilus sp. oral taxon 375 str. F0436]
MFEWIKDKLKGAKEKEEDLSTSTPSEDKEKVLRNLTKKKGLF